MTHFGIICPAESGHLNTFIPLGKELLLRGHSVTVIASLDGQKKVTTAGLEFKPIGEDIFPLGSLKERFAELGKLSDLAALKYTIELFKDSAISVLRDAPQVIKEAGIEALLVDQTSSEAGTVAELTGIPFVTVCSAVVLNRDPDIPPFSTTWKYSPTWWGRLRNQLGYKILSQIVKPRYDVLTEYRQKWNLPLHSSVNKIYSPLAQISHQPAEFEFTRTTLPKWFHFTGPYHYSASREPVAFPWEKLTGQPLIYASMGTLQNRLINVFEKIASACEGLDAQLVITLGGSATPESLPELPGNPLVVSYAPQLELLQKATLTITHAGMNTTLECLTNGVPMVAIPVANDQPGIAARVAWTGVGEVVPLKKLSVERLQKAVKQVLTEDSYKKNALRLQEAIKQAGGVKKAADIIEQAVSTGKPVLARV
ncbi:glycosyltransferase [Rivularia sp. UHCC 0363]|uniref:glycosyltransferase n=1 Tax=Rivularia sp. UHCC 0363 TaxID=3110244 RepID=UPI002B1FC4BF|nr:glycosyltransferase [Rivularia sp. UHCC 0363]MEA5593225.1 glycosyltransferase [Rivularia sp. UHCC 0363]